MSYSFPRLAFDRKRYVSLDQAFQTLGSYLFPTEWDGREIACWPFSSTQSLLEELESLRTRSEGSAKQLGRIKLDFHKERDQDTQDELEILLRKAEQQADLERANLEDFKQSYDSRIRDAVAYERKQEVIAKLCRAVRDKELILRLRGGVGYSEMGDWMDHPKFRISFEYSYVVTPVRLGKRQKSKAYFDKGLFDDWTAPLLPPLASFRTAAVEDDLISWFKSAVKALEERGERVSHAALLETCQNSFQRAEELPKFESAFNAVWELFAPASWKKGGKPSNLARV